MIYNAAIGKIVYEYPEAMIAISEHILKTLPDSVRKLFINSVPQLKGPPHTEAMWLVDLVLPPNTIVPDDLTGYALAIYNSTAVKRTRIRFEGRIWDYYQT